MELGLALTWIDDAPLRISMPVESNVRELFPSFIFIPVGVTLRDACP